MKQLFTKTLATIILVAATLSASAADREHTLKIYNWSDYIGENTLSEFKAWYKEQTGEEIDIIYQLFDINEIMLAKIERGKEDFDVVCPSEYIIERMLRKDLLLPLEMKKHLPDSINYLKNISPYIIERFGKIDGYGKNANDYAVGYMWGTTGILYNTKYVTREEASSWEILRNPKFNKKILIKDAFRDVYSTMLTYLKHEALTKGEITLDSLMYDASDKSIAEVEALLMEAKQYAAGWEADFGKEMMIKENVYVNLNWSGDAKWAIDEAKDAEVELDYVVPKEGSNVWFDGWVIPKYAKNTKAARYFINFLCRSDIAINNMNEIGYVSVIATPEVLKGMCDTTRVEGVDASYFFGEEAKCVKLDPVQYPDISVIKRCGMMHDSGDRTPKMLEMWARVKHNDIPLWIWIVIAVSFSALAFIYIRRRVIISRKKSHRVQRKATTKRK